MIHKSLKRISNSDKKKLNAKSKQENSTESKEFVTSLLEKLSDQDNLSIAFGILNLIYKNNFNPLSRDYLLKTLLDIYRKDKNKYVKFKKEKGSSLIFSSESQLKMAFDKVLEENKSIIIQKNNDDEELVSLDYDETLNHIRILPRSYLYNLFGEEVFKKLFPIKYQKIISSIKPFLRKNEELKKKQEESNNKNVEDENENENEEERNNLKENENNIKTRTRNREKIISLSSDDDSEEINRRNQLNLEMNNKLKRKRGMGEFDYINSGLIPPTNELNKINTNVNDNLNIVEPNKENNTDNSIDKNIFGEDYINFEKSQMDFDNEKVKNELVFNEKLKDFNTRKKFILSLPVTIKNLKDNIHIIKNNSNDIIILLKSICDVTKKNTKKNTNEKKKSLIGEIGNNKSIIELSYENIKSTINSINNINDINQNFNKEILENHKHMLENYGKVYNNSLDKLCLNLKKINEIYIFPLIKNKFNEINQKYLEAKERGLAFNELENVIKDIRTILNESKSKIENYISEDEVKENYLSKKRKLIDSLSEKLNI